jgi:oxygen-independent coproporphyrinogen-3 oxidase
MPNIDTPLSLYLHIPFCTHRCAYCDFNTYAGQEALIPAYVDALCKEIEFVGSRVPCPSRKGEPEGRSEVHTIFFGGGTPSLLSPRQFESILNSIRRSFGLTDDVEITIEANPGTCSFADLLDLHSLGINRISFGVQSANAFELQMLERAHNFFDVIEAVASARKAGFHNLNLDLIYGLPEQTLQSWRTTIKRILDLHPEHISAYALTLEHGTPFGKWAAKGILPLPDPDLAAEMYEWVDELLEASGHVQYEISNWALDNGRRLTIDPNPSSTVYAPPSFACRHNLQYWRSLPYLAFGAGAHGYANGYRYSNVLRIKTYVDRLNTDHWSLNTAFPLSPVAVNHHQQTLQDDISEFMMTGLRLTQEGISFSEFERRFGRSVDAVFGKEIEQLLKFGLLERIDSPLRMGEGLGVRVRLTKRGRLLGNQVFMRFV